MAGYTKRYFIEKAFEEIGYASYIYDLDPEKLQSALNRLDSMMAEWNGKKINLGYPLPDGPGSSSLGEESNVPDFAHEAMIANLAIRLAPSVGKTVSVDTKKSARSSYLTLLSRASAIKSMNYSNTLPAGAGNKTRIYDNPFMIQPSGNDISPPEPTLEFE